MSNTVIQLKYSAATGNTPTALANGELAINTYDGKIFYRGGASNTIQSITRYTGPAGLDTELQFNDAGSLGGSQNLTFNKTTSVLTVAGTVRANIHSNDGTDLFVFANGAYNTANAAFIKANNAFANTTGTFNGTLSVSETFKSLQSIGDEGGQIDLATAATNQSLVGGTVSIDIFQNKFRIFESGGTNRGVYIDIANSASTGVGTNLLQPSTSTDGWARNQANAAFISANTIQTYVTSANANISLLQSYVTTANANITAAFAAANAATATDTTQNNSITAAFVAANSSGVYANGSFITANSAGVYANGAFARANNSLNVQAGGAVTGNLTITGNLTVLTLATVPSLNVTTTITTGSGTGGVISGANTVYSNVFVANTSGYFQFADGTKQYTANSGGGTTDTFARNQANAAFAFANTISAGSVDTFARNQANAAFSAANTAQSTATSAQGTATSAASDASFALSTACTAQTSATTANDTATSAFIQANAAFIKANTGTSSSDYFPTGDWGNLTDAITSAFGEDTIVMYDCRVEPVTPRGYLLSKDFGYVA